MSRPNVDGHKQPRPEPFEVRFRPVPSTPNTPLPEVTELPPEMSWYEWRQWQETEVDDLK